MTHTLTIHSTTSSALLSPVDHVTTEQKDALILAVRTWQESAPRTERTDYIADRDDLLIRWLWHTGMRVSDALAIRFDDINTNTETVRFVVAKRSRRTPFIHQITLSKAMMFEVMKYRDRWQIALIHFGGRLFPITRQNVNKSVEIAFRLAHSSTQVTESVYARMNTDIERKMLEGITW